MSVIASAVQEGWVVTATSAANAIATATKAAVVGTAHYVTGIDCTFDADVGPLLVELYDDTTVIWRTHLRNGETRKVFTVPVRITTSKLTKVTLAAGGAGIVGVASLDGFSTKIVK